MVPRFYVLKSHVSEEEEDGDDGDDDVRAGPPPQAAICGPRVIGCCSSHSPHSHMCRATELHAKVRIKKAPYPRLN